MKRRASMAELARQTAAGTPGSPGVGVAATSALLGATAVHSSVATSATAATPGAAGASATPGASGGSRSYAVDDSGTMSFAELVAFTKAFHVVPEMMDLMELQTLFAVVNRDAKYVYLAAAPLCSEMLVTSPRGFAVAALFRVQDDFVDLLSIAEFENILARLALRCVFDHQACPTKVFATPSTTDQCCILLRVSCAGGSARPTVATRAAAPVPRQSAA